MSEAGEIKSKLEPARILLVDDEVRNLETLASILESPGHALLRASTPDEALLAVLEHDFAVILLDVRMPGMSGIDLAVLIKNRKRSHDVPIIFLTAHASDEADVLHGYDAGAADFLTKPVNPKILKTKVAVFVDLFNQTKKLLRAEESLREANLELEARVRDRTAVLTQLNHELQRSGALIQERELRYRQLIKNLPVAVYTTDAEGRVTLFNESAATLWGRSPVIGRDLWCGSYKIYQADGTELPADECPMAIALKEGRAVRGREIIIERPDGTRKNVLPYPDPIRDASGTIVGAINLLLDITEIKRAEAGLRHFAAIVESSEDAIVSKNLNGIITSWNQGAERLFGYAAAEAIGRPITILMPDDRRNEEPRILEKIRSGQRIEHYETVRQRKNGQLIDISLTVSPIKDANGQVVGVSKIVRDITAQKQTERELAQAHGAVVAASRAKDDFLAALSHELRTPLNPVLLIASDAVANPAFSDEVRSMFQTIQTNVELEARLIDDLLDLTRITHGKLSLKLEEVEIQAVLNAAIQTVQCEFMQKQIALTLRLADAKPWVKADPIRLQQVFWNVLKNAVKFTPAGGEVKIETETWDLEKRVRVKITDNGIGLTAPELDLIFNAFSQGDHATEGTSHRFGGLGLGLSISRRLMELQGGKIEAASEGRGQGATFSIELPLSLGVCESRPDRFASHNGTHKAEPAHPPGTQGIRILLVEDHEPTRAALMHLLARRKHTVLSANSLVEARRIVSETRVDFVISDVGLPDGDGYTLMAELRKNFGLQGIALTGYGMEEDVLRGKKAGFIGHLIKPVRIESLDEILNTLN